MPGSSGSSMQMPWDKSPACQSVAEHTWNAGQLPCHIWEVVHSHISLQLPQVGHDMSLTTQPSTPQRLPVSKLQQQHQQTTATPGAGCQSEHAQGKVSGCRLARD